MGARVVVVGSSNTDLVVRAPRIPGPGETLLGGEFARMAGGKGANQAVAAARLGAEVMLVARVGDDDMGQAALDAYRAEGIDTEFIVRDPDAPSGVALIVVSEAGENAITVAPGANSRLSPRDVERASAAIEAADVVLLQLETPLEASRKAIEIARRGTARVILDPAPARPLNGELLASVDIVTPNRTEASLLARSLAGVVHATAAAPHDKVPNPNAPSAAERDAATLLAAGAPATLVTLGAEGVLWADADGARHYACETVAVIDTTAAGDAFNGALAVSLARGRDVSSAIVFAQGAAALSVTRAGAQPSLPTLDEVERAG